MNFVSFDIEIAKVLPEGETNFDDHRPLGISCAATICTGDEEPRLWYGKTPDGSQPQMSRGDCQDLVGYLVELHQAGTLPLTWNGLGFDFKILAEESGLFDLCRALALHHVDMMFHFFCIKGFAIGLDASCKGMNLPGKPEGMSGALAPVMWKEGKRQAVLDYVASDVVEPLALAEKVGQTGGLSWKTKRGRIASVAIPEWLTVTDALALDLPDTSWMDNPWPRSKFTDWLKMDEMHDDDDCDHDISWY